MPYCVEYYDFDTTKTLKYFEDYFENRTCILNIDFLTFSMCE